MNSTFHDVLHLLRQVIHSDRPPTTCPVELREHGDLAELYDELIRLRCFTKEIATGNLSTKLALKGYTAGALKSLQANLKHLTWQTQMIAAGDFSQRLDFMGEFSDAFNSMTMRLEQSIKIIKEKEHELSLINAGLLREIEIRKQTQSTLVEREAHYRNLTETMKDVVWIFDTSALRFTYVSPSIMALRGVTPQEMITQPLEAFLTAQSAAHFKAVIQEHRSGLLADSGTAESFYTFEAEVLSKDGSTVWTEVVARSAHNERNGTVDIHGVMRDISDRKALQMELQRQATIDELTGIYNRRHFLGCAEKEIKRCQRHGGSLTFVMLDIDNFKKVNDSFGHAVGDLALKAVAETCACLLRSSDVIGRVGGEEFAVLMIETTLSRGLTAAERMRHQVENIHLATVSGTLVPLTISMGIAEYRHESDSLTVLMARADKALYAAKENGRNRVAAEA